MDPKKIDGKTPATQSLKHHLQGFLLTSTSPRHFPNRTPLCPPPPPPLPNMITSRSELQSSLHAIGGGGRYANTAIRQAKARCIVRAPAGSYPAAFRTHAGRSTDPPSVRVGRKPHKWTRTLCALVAVGLKPHLENGRGCCCSTADLRAHSRNEARLPHVSTLQGKAFCSAECQAF